MPQLFREGFATVLHNMSRHCVLLGVGLTASLSACAPATKGGTPLCAGYYVDETESASGKSVLFRKPEENYSVIVEGDLLEVQGNCFYIFATQRGNGQEVIYTVVNILENRGYYAQPVSKQYYDSLFKKTVMGYHFTF
ncbi:hypothetical protein [Hymenobacter negativus]|uniref:DUF4377 domain-containing protein n=1 Tax=Hymenobacter negativus TaxID=2795026 RepID=A0ABS3Q9G6_9BACT|nr:hypothetical protein [Hymenobacter negativus]MBO2007889.1 hypothetical protein [Hymenobacter negativus]